MSFLTAVKVLTLGILAQIALFAVVGTFTNNGEVLIYVPWLFVGEWVMPSGPGGHAMPLGGMLGVVFGFLVYAAVIGYPLHRLIMHWIASRKR